MDIFLFFLSSAALNHGSNNFFDSFSCVLEYTEYTVHQAVQF